MTSQTGKQIITKYLLRNISESKVNQTVKLGHLLEYIMRNIFLEKSYTKCGGESIPRSFLKSQICAYPWINSLKFYTAFVRPS